MNTLLLIDGNAIMHRAFHAIPPFKTSSGIPTNVIYGFFTMLNKAVTDFKPDHVVVCFDTPAPTFRKKLFTAYQAQRPKIADEFKSQIPLLKEALSKAGITYFEKDGFEADDLIGTLAKKYSNSGKESKVLILTGDKDILQLVNGAVFVVSPQTGLSNIKIYDLNEVKKKFNLPPDKIPDLKALMGDSSDNYSGAKGIGPKTAAKLLNEFGSVDNIYLNLNKIAETPKKSLEENRENVLLSHKLATINTDVDINLDIKKTEFDKFDEELKNFFEKYEMKSLAARIFIKPGMEITETKIKKSKTPEDQMDLF